MIGDRPVRIGLLGAANIVPRALLAPAKLLDRPCSFAVAARDPAKARAFAQAHGIDTVFADYDALLASERVDGVYLALPNSLHVHWAIRALRAGKPVLVEKPFCIDLRDFDTLAAVARASGVPVVEAIMIGFHPWQQALAELIQDGRYGPLLTSETRLFTDLRGRARDGFRFSRALGGGAFFDLGVYWVQFLQRCIGLHGYRIAARAERDAPDGVDLSFTVQLDFPNGPHCELSCSFERAFAANHRLTFEQATVTVGNFLRPAFGLQALWLDIEHGGRTDKIRFSTQNYYAAQLDFFIRVIEREAEPEPLATVRERVAAITAIYGQAAEGMRTADPAERAWPPA